VSNRSRAGRPTAEIGRFAELVLELCGDLFHGALYDAVEERLANVIPRSRAAAILGVAPATVNAYADAGHLRRFSDRRESFFLEDQVEALADQLDTKVSRTEAARLLGCTEADVRAMVRDGRLRRFGKDWSVLAVDVERVKAGKIIQ